MFFALARNEVAAGDDEFFSFGVAAEFDDLEAVPQWAGDRSHIIGGRDEHDL